MLLDTLDTMRRTVSTQVASAVRAYLRRDETLARAIHVKDGYVDNLNSQAQLLAQQTDAHGNRRLARCAWTMAANLEHIGDYAVNVAGQFRHRVLADQPEGTHVLDEYRTHVLRGMTRALRALGRENMEDAYAACRDEEALDRLYAEDLEVLIRVMSRGGDEARDALTWAFVTKNLERMGDMVLNLGEAVLSYLCGERVKLEHLRTIENLVPASRVQARGIWGGISGAFIALVEREGQAAIYKGGPREKILREFENLERWEAIAPGITAAVVREPTEGDPSGLLLEHIAGETLEDALLRGRHEIEPPLERLFDTLVPVWEATLEPNDQPMRFVGQIRARLGELYDVHPRLAELRARPRRFGRLLFPALADLLEEAERREGALTAPFSVFLHGDLNLSNLLLPDAPAPGGGGPGVRVIDVYRSRRGDLAQDLSVLMVSCVRHPLSAGPLAPAAARARRAFEWIHRRGCAWAEAHGDRHFRRRLKLGLARSFITSGRVLRDDELALDLFLKGIQYLEDFVCVRSAS
jgi:phosphate uptake regulator